MAFATALDASSKLLFVCSLVSADTYDLLNFYCRVDGLFAGTTKLADVDG